MGIQWNPLKGPMVHATSAIRPKGAGAFAAWVAKQGWNAVSFKTMNEWKKGGKRPPKRGAFLERVGDSTYFRAFQAVAAPLGITAIPYVFVSPWDAKNQGRNFGRQVVDFGAKFACANVEEMFEKVAKALRVKASTDWLDGFWEVAGPKVTLILSTFAEIKKHPAFPFREWIPRVDVFSGQAYSQRPAAQVRAMVEMAAQFGMAPDRVWPAFRAYEGDGYFGKKGILRTTSEAMDTARELGIVSWMFWQQKTMQVWPEMLRLCRGAAAPEERSAKDGGRRGKDLQVWLNSVREAGDPLLVVDGDVGMKSIARLRVQLGRLPDPLAVARAANIKGVVERLEVDASSISGVAEGLEHTFSD